MRAWKGDKIERKAGTKENKGGRVLLSRIKRRRQGEN